MSSEGGPCLTKVIGYLSARLTSVEEYRPLKSECHSLYRRAQPFVAPENLCQLRCVISTVRLGSCQLISGIKVCPSDGESGTSQWIGYRSPGNETWFDIPKDKRIRAFDISLSPEGLRGIQILYTGSGESRWVGDKHGRGIARGTLFLPSGEGRYYLLAELDRFKIITLGFGEMTGRQKRASHPSPSSTIATRCSQIKSCLWEPCIPTHRGLIISPLLPLKAPPTFNPLLNFDFGGWRGRQLSVLTRLDFHLTHDRHPLIGLVAYYANKGSITCGSTGGHAMSIFLDSSNGERVTQVSTSFGQTVTFAPLFHHLNASVRTISGVPPDHTITGLVAHPMSYKGHFDQIRIQSQMCDVAPTNSDVPNRDRHRVPTDQIRYDLMLHQRNDTDYMRFYPTYASLKGVRTIAASTAEGPYSPMARYITGLKFEYYDHPSPSVVGQWIYPLSKEKTELSPDEEVESITVWINSSSKSRFPGMRTGQISAIYITTTAQRLEFYAGSLALTLAIQGQYKRDTDEELTAISWVLGADSDRVRAVISPKGKQKTHILNPPLSAPYEGVNKLYFARPYGGTWKKKLRWVEVYYDGVEIVGLRFIYKSNDRATIGNKFSGTLDRIFHFPEYDKITGFSVKAAGSALMQLELEIKRGRSYRYLSLGQESHPRYTYDRHCYWGENPAHFQTSTNPYRQPLMEKVYKPPKNSRLTGIYVDYHWISLIGAIYEPVRTETNSS
ncbi:hypothetical protein AbraIFM66950_010801 [Aspergillus brasiliensis]|nr:hypothetical protein AbraIFM66950_010801 [Aspergillus brasiliensis]